MKDLITETTKFCCFFPLNVNVFLISIKTKVIELTLFTKKILNMFAFDVFSVGVSHGCME